MLGRLRAQGLLMVGPLAAAAFTAVVLAATATSTTDSGPMAGDDRKGTLDRTLQKAGAAGWRIETRSDFQATIARGDRPNHLLHLILTILTGGLWRLFVWAPVVAFGGLKRRMITIDEYGDVIDNKV